MNERADTAVLLISLSSKTKMLILKSLIILNKWIDMMLK